MSGSVVILTSQPPEAAGGVESFVRLLIRGFADRGYDVETLNRNLVPRWMEGAGRALKLQAVVEGLSIGRAARARSANATVISNSTIGWYPLPAAIRRVHMFHGTYRGMAEAIKPFISRKGYTKLKYYDSMTLERVSGRGKTCLCNSDQTREEVESFFGIPCSTVWLPLDTGFWKPQDKQECRRLLRLDPGAFIGLYAGSDHPQKGFSTVMALLSARRDVNWVMALRGSSSFRPPEGIRVWNDASPEVMRSLYGAADFVIAPSRYEPFGYIVAEALAVGVPVITTPGGASTEFMSPMASLTVDNGDNVAGFSRAIDEVHESSAALQKVIAEQVRPKLESLLSPPNWWNGFLIKAGMAE
ncbi:MAG TPA: glycosyltransferase family 4 protein [Actinomycetota bacterium]|nr:glycosyltransferase family 4 protein [Actinomycetota bacterium]